MGYEQLMTKGQADPEMGGRRPIGRRRHQG